uniref:Uncharacterized protein n=1 Tax=Anguilla anguilla TaxID=7936 RepID=A0A0E9XLV3_ANGAN
MVLQQLFEASLWPAATWFRKTDTQSFLFLCNSQQLTPRPSMTFQLVPPTQFGKQ